jgi:hypothetical protein
MRVGVNAIQRASAAFRLNKQGSFGRSVVLSVANRGTGSTVIGAAMPDAYSAFGLAIGADPAARHSGQGIPGLVSLMLPRVYCVDLVRSPHRRPRRTGLPDAKDEHRGECLRSLGGIGCPCGALDVLRSFHPSHHAA